MKGRTRPSQTNMLSSAQNKQTTCFTRVCVVLFLLISAPCLLDTELCTPLSLARRLLCPHSSVFTLVSSCLLSYSYCQSLAYSPEEHKALAQKVAEAEKEVYDLQVSFLFFSGFLGVLFWSLFLSDNHSLLDRSLFVIFCLLDCCRFRSFRLQSKALAQKVAEAEKEVHDLQVSFSVLVWLFWGVLFEVCLSVTIIHSLWYHCHSLFVFVWLIVCKVLP